MDTFDTPDFFQQDDETALRERAQWLDDNLGLDCNFLSKLLHENEAKIIAWRNKGDRLSAASELVFRDLWHVVLHLLSHYNNDEQGVRKLLEQIIPAGPTQAGGPNVETASPLCPPWFHS